MKVVKKKITDFSLSEKEKFKIEKEKRIKREKEEQELAEKLLAERLEQERRLPEEEHLDSEGQQRHSRTRPVRLESNEQGQRYQVQYIQPPSSPHIRESRLDGSYNDLQSIGDSGPSGVKMEQLQDQGVLGQMQNAFSSIVQNVDPAPVLGVSGGMGVLFILFKYTPFGSFFGGRRGRFRQIPSFRGLSPDLANFQEYGGGYVGYSQMNMPFQGE